MLLSEQHIIKQTHLHYKELMDLCHKSKNLYNATLYIIRQHYFDTGKYLNYLNAYNEFKLNRNQDFYALPSGISLLVMRLVDKNFKSFFNLLKLKKQGNYNKPINIPKYLKKDGYYQIIYTQDRFNKNYKADKFIKLLKTDIKIYNIKHLDTCKLIRFIPKSNYIILEAIYEVKEKQLKLDNHRYMSIDLGVNNLCTCTSNVIKSFIIDGKSVKHINHNFNKRKALLQKKLNKKQYTSNLINRITRKRNFRIHNYFHNVSKYIVNQAVDNQINTIVIGLNKGWKQETKFKNKNNTLNFIQIPFNKLIQMISYKAKLQGINVVLQEESYTSKVSFIDNDYIPVYGIDDLLFKPSGKRKYRGLYITKLGLKLNGDVNGSLNILRKHLKRNSDDLLDPADVGFVVNPVKVKL